MSSKILPLKVVFSTTEMSEVAEANGVLAELVGEAEGLPVALGEVVGVVLGLPVGETVGLVVGVSVGVVVGGLVGDSVGATDTLGEGLGVVGEGPQAVNSDRLPARGRMTFAKLT